MGVEEQLPPPLRGLPWLAGALAAAALLAPVDGGAPPVDAGAVTGSIELGGGGVAQGVADGSGSLDLGGSGDASARPAGSGSLTLGGSGPAEVVTAAAGSLALGGSGSVEAEPAAAGSLDLGGTSTASAQPAAAGSIVLGGTGTWTTVAGGSLDLGGAGSGAAEPVAAGSLTLGGSGSPAGVGAGSGSLTLGGAGAPRASGVGAGSLTLGGTGTGTSSASASGTGSLTLGGTAVAVKLGVLKVNVGTALSPDWRNIGCGGGSTSFLDDFNRSVGTLNGDNGWSGDVNWTINGSHRAASAAVGFAFRYLGRDTTVTAGTVTVQLTATDLFNYPAELYVRANSTATQYVALVVENAGIRIADTTGASTTVDSTVRTTLSGTLRIDWTATTVTAYLNGTLLGAVTSGTYASNTYAGFATFGPTNTFDDFAGPPPTTGRLKLWDGTQWVREKCDSEPLVTYTVSDNFDRADTSGTVGTASDGGTWTQFRTAMKILSNKVRWADADSISRQVPGTTSDMTVTANNFRGPEHAISSYMFLNSQFSNGLDRGGAVYYAEFNSAHNVDIRRQSGGVVTSLASTTTYTGWTNTTALLSFSRIGDTLTFKVNGSMVLSVTDPSPLPYYQAGTLNNYRWCGLRSSIPGATGVLSDESWDDFNATGTGPPDSHPLYVWTGTAWDRVACLVPA